MNVRFITASLLFSATMAFAQQTPQEQQLFEMTNQARAGQNLPPLQWDESLAAAARTHSQKMAGSGSLSHQLPGEPELRLRAGQAGAHFRVISENIAMGGNTNELQREWLHSPPHRANILDSNVNRVGIGVVQRNGYLYATVDFDSSVDTLNFSQIEQQVAAMLQKEGIGTSGPVEAARKDCAVEDGEISGSHARFVMRWESSRLDRLPPPLEDRIHTGKYKSAAVGACSSGGQGQGFTSYRIAVLLY